MALIQDLSDHPFDALAHETRRLIDLAIDMCRPQSDGGIVATEDGDPIARPLHEGGAEAWKFIRGVRARAWEKAGLDPSLLSSPKSAKEIHFNGFPGQFDDIALPDDDVHSDNWLGPFPQLGEDWMSFFADLPAEWNL